MNSNTSPDILSKLAKDSKYKVRCSVASNPNTPPDILSKLANDSKWLFRERLIFNPKTPPETLRLLANDPEKWVRDQVRSRIPYEVDENDFGYIDNDFDDWS